ncbi:MAG: hypothetical protein JWN70_6963 [Planctomycetaceae bacterium]|nr:hypothetical protein [Planctomycetaceae bacterium]
MRFDLPLDKHFAANREPSPVKPQINDTVTSFSMVYFVWGDDFGHFPITFGGFSASSIWNVVMNERSPKIRVVRVISQHTCYIALYGDNVQKPAE